MEFWTKSSKKLKLFDLGLKGSKKSKKWWLRALHKPFAVLVMVLSAIVILIGIAGLVLPLVPGILLISVGLSLMFYSLDRMQS